MFIDWNVSVGIISRTLPTMPQPHAGPRSPLPRSLQPLTNNFRSTTINSIPRATQDQQKCEVLTALSEAELACWLLQTASSQYTLCVREKDQQGAHFFLTIHFA
jgi:hypothetical protein